MLKYNMVEVSRIQIKVMLYSVYSWRVGKAVYCCAHAVQCRSASAVVLGERLIYNGCGRAWASLGHWACIRLSHAIGPRHPSY